MRVLVTGGAGYVGCRLVPALLDDGHEVVAYDTFWFGDHLPPISDYSRPPGISNPGLTKIKNDIRNIDRFREAVQGCDVVLHLACVSNDPSFELDESLSRTINYEAFEPLVVVAKEAGVRRFIYCSTSSVYGVSDAPSVTEEHPLVPLTLYNTYKGMCEPLLFKHQAPDFECVVIRPSTICGYSPRQRLDLAVNILTNLAYNTGKIVVHGGQQLRPNLHIEDMVDCYRSLIAAPANQIAGQTFNVGAGNHSITTLAEMVRNEVEAYRGEPVEIETQPIQDVRSYQVNSDKISRTLGFRPTRSLGQAVRQLCTAFKTGLIPDPMGRSEYYNVRRMKEVFADLYRDAPPSVFRPEAGHLSEVDVTHRGVGK